ncbi:MAG: helicase-related protein, partial [Planctomycetota bacterium]
FQAEMWFRSLMDARPDWIGAIAIHHGSLDRKIRTEVERLVRTGKLKAVVCTSSLDLGVDFPEVDQVIQIGSPKGVGRLMQRAGRAGHAPGKISRVLCVPTHAFELIEFSAAREGVEARRVEDRAPLEKPLDVLVQHLVTVASGGGFVADELRGEVRSTRAYRDLSDDEWTWALDFVERGGPTLTAYQQFQKVVHTNGKHAIANDRLARMHRLGIGTITDNGVLQLRLRSGRNLGTIEEGYIGKLNPGDTFSFAGRPLELLHVRNMTATVRPSKKRGTVTQWAGAKFPLSTNLAAGVRRRMEDALDGVFDDTEMETVAPLLKLQARWSALPRVGELLVETMKTREGGHVFLFPFLGRLVHEGLGAVLALRIGRLRDMPMTATFTDYGIELLAPQRLELSEAEWRGVLEPAALLEDLLECLNAGELTKRQFRGISRVAGLLLPSSPGAPKSNRQLQASSELFYQVFTEFDPNNLLLEQARREVLEEQLEVSRLREALETLETHALVMTEPRRLTPLSFPLWASRIQSQTLRVEAAADRIERMMRQLEKAAG